MTEVHYGRLMILLRAQSEPRNLSAALQQYQKLWVDEDSSRTQWMRDLYRAMTSLSHAQALEYVARRAASPEELARLNALPVPMSISPPEPMQWVRQTVTQLRAVPLNELQEELAPKDDAVRKLEKQLQERKAKQEALQEELKILNALIAPLEGDVKAVKKTGIEAWRDLAVRRAEEIRELQRNLKGCKVKKEPIEEEEEEEEEEDVKPHIFDSAASEAYQLAQALALDLPVIRLLPRIQEAQLHDMQARHEQALLAKANELQAKERAITELGVRLVENEARINSMRQSLERASIAWHLQIELPVIKLRPKFLQEDVDKTQGDSGVKIRELERDLEASRAAHVACVLQRTEYENQLVALRQTHEHLLVAQGLALDLPIVRLPPSTSSTDVAQVRSLLQQALESKTAKEKELADVQTELALIRANRDEIIREGNEKLGRFEVGWTLGLGVPVIALPPSTSSADVEKIRLECQQALNQQQALHQQAFDSTSVNVQAQEQANKAEQEKIRLECQQKLNQQQAVYDRALSDSSTNFLAADQANKAAQTTLRARITQLEAGLASAQAIPRARITQLETELASAQSLLLLAKEREDRLSLATALALVIPVIELPCAVTAADRAAMKTRLNTQESLFDAKVKEQRERHQRELAIHTATHHKELESMRAMVEAANRTRDIAQTARDNCITYHNQEKDEARLKTQRAIQHLERLAISAALDLGTSVVRLPLWEDHYYD
jgi:hypothetical protein